MSIISGINDFFGLDIGTTSIRLVQLKHNGKDAPKSLVKYAHVPIDPKLVLSEAKGDQQKVMEVIHKLITDAKVSTPNVVVGLPSKRVFTTVVDIDRLNHNELEKTIHYQADALIPTPLAESKMDWALLGDSPQDKTKYEILVTSVSNEYAEARLDLLESIGLNVIAFEPEGIALLRSLVPEGSAAPVLVLDMGSKATDLVVSLNGAPRLVRSIPTGTDAIVRAASQNLNIDEVQAQQFVNKFGLINEKLEGQVRGAIINVVDILMSEVEKSIKFYMTRYPESPIERIVVTGGAAVLPEFPLYVATKFGMQVEIGNAWRNVAFPSQSQNELLSVSSFFSVAAGLAERKE